MNRFKKLKVFCGVAVLGLSSCTHKSDLTNLRVVSFNKEVLPIFQTSCGQCHASKGKNFTTYDGIMKDVKAGNANQSNIYTTITSSISRMPPTSHDALNQDQRSLIYVWIQQGAKNN